MFESPDYFEVQDEEVTGSTTLPFLDVPLKDMKFSDLKDIAIVCVEQFSGSRIKGYGNPDAKPVWWPETVRWGSLQSGVKKHQFQEVIVSCYAYHGQTPNVSFNEINCIVCCMCFVRLLV